MASSQKLSLNNQVILCPNLDPSPEDTLRILEQAIASSGSGIVIADMLKPGQPIIYCNSAFEKITGYSSHEVLGQNCKFLQGPDTDPVAIEKIRNSIRSAQHCRVILRNYRKDGIPFWNELTLSPVINEVGILTHFIGIQSDITQKMLDQEREKQAQAELQRRDRILAGITEVSNHLLTMTDARLAIHMALAKLGQAVGVERVYLFEYYSDPSSGKNLMVLHSKWAKDQEDQTACPQLPLLVEDMGNWWQETLERGETISGVVSDLPEPTRSILQQQQVVSILAVPILLDDRCWGFVGFDYSHKHYQWSVADKSILMTAAAMLGGAIARQKAEAKLATLNSQLESLVKQRTFDLEITNEQLRQEITIRRHMEAKLRYNADHDSLTGLPNRSLLMQTLQRAIDRSRVDLTYQFSLLFLDLDRFKVINDSLGHSAGDALLVAIGETLSRCINPGEDLVARLSGDEFAVFLAGGLNAAKATAEQIIQEITQPFVLSGQEIFTSVSIGIAPSHSGYRQPQEILRDADLVMYQAKNSGRACYRIFDQAMHQQIVSALQLENDLRRAVNSLNSDEPQQFFLEYQPIMALQTGKILGFEALLRWRHPQKGAILPSVFIDLAEETGLINRIGDWVLQTACTQAVYWQKKYNPKLSISINLSANQFSNTGLVDAVDRVLELTGLDGRTLNLEITETLLMERAIETTQTIKRLRDRQIKLCMDDFGTGYSSLSYLHQFSFDTLKLDRSFIQQMESEPRHAKIVQTIIDLAHHLGMQVVAEGLETLSQLQQLQQLNCECGQGFLFAMPLSPKATEQLLDGSR